MLSKAGKEIERKYAEAHWGDNANLEEDTIVGGGFEFTNLIDGEYTISIYKLGYNKVTQTVTLNNEESQVLDPFVLEPEIDFANTTAANTTSFIVVNSLPDAFNKPLFTEALNLAVDTEYIANTIYSDENNIVPTRILPPAVDGNNQDDLTNFDLDKAKTIISENEFSEDLTFYYYNSSDVPASFKNLITYLKSQWEKLNGITINFIPFNNNDDYNSAEDNFRKSGWVLDNPDPLFNLKEIANNNGASESTKNKLDEAKLVLDDETRAMEYIYEAEKIMIDNGQFIILSHYLNN